MKLSLVLGAALLALGTGAYAQSTSPQSAPPSKAERRFDCSKAKDPKACEEMRAKMREAAKKARAACDSKAGDERRDCMRKEMCAQSKDAAKCEANAKARAEKRKQRTPQDKK